MENPRADRALATGFGLVVGIGCSVHAVVRGVRCLNVGDHDAAAGSVLMAFAGASFAGWMLRGAPGARALHLAWMGAWFAVLLYLLTRASTREVAPILMVGGLGGLMVWLVGKRIAAAATPAASGGALAEPRAREAKPVPADDAPAAPAAPTTTQNEKKTKARPPPT